MKYDITLLSSYLKKMELEANFYEYFVINKSWFEIDSIIKKKHDQMLIKCSCL